MEAELPYLITGEQIPLPDDTGFYGLEICVNGAMLQDLLSAIYIYTLFFQTEAGYALYAEVLKVLSTEWVECE